MEAPGELSVGGIGLAGGYVKRADLTAERFIRIPFGLEPGDRLYKTGDLARWLPNGGLEDLGRADRQVRIRGHRIEPQEVDPFLESCAAIRACAVDVRVDLPLDKRLVCCLVTLPG